MLLSGGVNGLPEQKRKVGTPFYLAPELWEDKDCSKKSDIWSLGVILYELCTHKYPYFANTMDELSSKVLKEKYTPIPMTVSK
jgi:serine/threonine protein kinase